MQNFINSLLDLIYKKKCYFCRSSKYSVIMCPNCYEKLELNDSLANRIINGVDIYCAGVYTAELQKMIRGLKYHRKKDLAYFQAKFMFEYLQSVPNLKNKDFELVAVPLHANRIKKRKYNHMELVAEEFAKLSGFKTNFKLIKRIKDTKPQYKLSKKQRLKNLSEAFVVEKMFISENPILILDDICTTGSTFEEMIKVMKLAGIKDITCLATSTPIQ